MDSALDFYAVALRAQVENFQKRKTKKDGNEKKSGKGKNKNSSTSTSSTSSTTTSNKSKTSNRPTHNTVTSSYLLLPVADSDAVMKRLVAHDTLSSCVRISAGVLELQAGLKRRLLTVPVTEGTPDWWVPEHDHALLQGTRMHGWGRWSDILDDTRDGFSISFIGREVSQTYVEHRLTDLVEHLKPESKRAATAPSTPNKVPAQVTLPSTIPSTSSSPSPSPVSSPPSSPQ